MVAKKVKGDELEQGALGRSNASTSKEQEIPSGLCTADNKCDTNSGKGVTQIFQSNSFFFLTGNLLFGRCFEKCIVCLVTFIGTFCSVCFDVKSELGMAGSFLIVTRKFRNRQFSGRRTRSVGTKQLCCFAPLIFIKTLGKLCSINLLFSIVQQ
ncbi:hypothetical protein CEXT_386631 [Caerostris extrusa]|uniref:Uncharacterized protein n=1 Tax=Caerostris extrusa TaxID=172846 RepID=A0AAV4T4H9_CAEEX|nr:hypothetical protein CEXT_386631 [Caerostris extrusa]